MDHKGIVVVLVGHKDIDLLHIYMREDIHTLEGVQGHKHIGHRHIYMLVGSHTLLEEV